MTSSGFKIIPLLIICFGVISRLLPHPGNFAPIAAISLFSGVYLDKKWAFIIPLFALLFSDLFLGFYGLEMLFVYGSFVLVVLIGEGIKKHKNVLTIFLGALGASILFYLITNFGVWFLPNTMYPKNFTGLAESYIAAIPFFRNTLLGDLFYTGVFFGGYEFIKIISKNFLPQKYQKMLF